MKQKNTKIEYIKQIGQKIHQKIHSHNFRQIILLSLIVLVLFLNLSILKINRDILNKITFEEPKKIEKSWEKDVRKITKDSPMEKMTPYISQKDKMTAAFLVGIAKKESNLGKFSPRLAGKDCYNYWGYRNQNMTTTPSGYTCFDSPRQAVSVVGRRISELIEETDLKTTNDMVVWKCGYSCDWDNPVAVQKWIDDVDFYVQKFYE